MGKLVQGPKFKVQSLRFKVGESTPLPPALSPIEAEREMEWQGRRGSNALPDRLRASGTG